MVKIKIIGIITLFILALGIIGWVSYYDIYPEIAGQKAIEVYLSYPSVNPSEYLGKKIKNIISTTLNLDGKLVSYGKVVAHPIPLLEKEREYQFNDRPYIISVNLLYTTKDEIKTEKIKNYDRR